MGGGGSCRPRQQQWGNFACVTSVLKMSPIPKSICNNRNWICTVVSTPLFCYSVCCVWGSPPTATCPSVGQCRLVFTSPMGRGKGAARTASSISPVSVQSHHIHMCLSSICSGFHSVCVCVFDWLKIHLTFERKEKRFLFMAFSTFTSLRCKSFYITKIH